MKIIGSQTFSIISQVLKATGECFCLQCGAPNSAIFAYNAEGKVIESGLAPTMNAVGQQRVQLDYATQGVN